MLGGGSHCCHWYQVGNPRSRFSCLRPVALPLPACSRGLSGLASVSSWLSACFCPLKTHRAPSSSLAFSRLCCLETPFLKGLVEFCYLFFFFFSFSFCSKLCCLQGLSRVTPSSSPQHPYRLESSQAGDPTPSPKDFLKWNPSVSPQAQPEPPSSVTRWVLRELVGASPGKDC